MNIEDNIIGVIHKYGLDLSNIKTLNVQGNQFGIPTKAPSIIIEYDESVRYDFTSHKMSSVTIFGNNKQKKNHKF